MMGALCERIFENQTTTTTTATSASCLNLTYVRSLCFASIQRKREERIFQGAASFLYSVYAYMYAINKSVVPY